MVSEQQLGIRTLATMARALGRSEELYCLLEIAAEEVVGALDAASVSISRLAFGTSTVRTIINAGDLGPGEVRWPYDEVYNTHHAANLGRVVSELATWTAHLGDADGDPFELDLLRELGKGSALGAPIVVDGRLWGECYATRHIGHTPFCQDDVAYVDVLMAILGGAISRALREKSLELLAFRDPLTGLLNRRGLDERAAPAFDVHPGCVRPITVVVLDINGLKQVNDTLGHPVGDQFIQAVAHALHAAFADIPGSLVARVGGDEFTVLVSDHDAADVVEAANSVCSRRWRWVAGTGVSAGAATAILTEHRALTPGELFAAADRAQYVAKRGRMSTTLVSDHFDDDPSAAAAVRGPVRSTG